MDTPASRRDFLQQAGTAVGTVALGLTTPAAREAAAAQTPQAAATLSRPAQLRALLRRPGLLVAPEAYTVIAGKLRGGARLRGDLHRRELNVYRTVRQYEGAGIAALHIEDSRNPKKMETWAGPGGPNTTELQPVEQMRERLQAAVDARRDRDFVIIGRTVAEDSNAVIRRGMAFAEAGADLVMNSLTGMTADEINRIARELPVPLLGIGIAKTHLTDTRMKVNIHPNIVSGAALALCDTIFRELKENGEVSSRPPLAPEMLARITGANTYSELAKRWLTTPSR